mmetsp:Transcript_81187/g.262426  ORF Transcript_81187/g.262426 Transcript_81187/m.262426 type:complete len:480 (-) Transcript_81187:1062-2501(-)
MLGRTTNFRSRSMPLIALAVGFLIAILPIAFDKSVAFLQYARRPSTMAGQKRKPRIQLRAMPGVLYGMEVESLLEQLQATPTESVILALERLWRPADASVSSLSGLVGEWDLLNADPQKRMSNNLFKAILNMYRSSLAKAMKVDFASAPRLTVAADGKMEMSSDLIMGPRRDSISFFGTVSLQGPNRFKDQPRAVRSQNLRVTLPLFQRARELRVTYYDGEVLVLRDSLGDADVFRRRRGENARPRALPTSAAVAVAPQMAPSPSRSFKEQVELLKEALQGHHANAAAAGAEAAATAGAFGAGEAAAAAPFGMAADGPAAAAGGGGAAAAVDDVAAPPPLLPAAFAFASSLPPVATSNALTKSSPSPAAAAAPLLLPLLPPEDPGPRKAASNSANSSTSLTLPLAAAVAASASCLFRSSSASFLDRSLAFPYTCGRASSSSTESSFSPAAGSLSKTRSKKDSSENLESPQALSSSRFAS